MNRRKRYRIIELNGLYKIQYSTYSFSNDLDCNWQDYIGMRFNGLYESFESAEQVVKELLKFELNKK